MKLDMKTAAFRILNITAATFFTLSAYVQYNDPDPEFWIPMYLLPTAISISISIKPSLTEKKFIKVIDFFYLFVATVTSAQTVHQNYDFEDNFIHWVVHDEAGREFGGLFVAIIWCAFMHDLSNLGIKLWIAAVVIFAPMLLWSYIYLNAEYRKLWPDHCQTALYPEKVDN